MDEKEIDYINVIPFVDIMLVLLTIVLTTSTFIATGGIRVNLPKASKNHEEVRQIQTVEIDQEGQIFFNSIPLTLGGLQASLQPVERSMPILIRADREISLQGFVDVLDAIKKLGFTKVSLQTELRR